MDIEDAVLEARILDAVTLCERRWQPQFLGFLDERQKNLAARILRRAENCLFWGGYPQAQRTLLGVFPTEDTRPEEFPLRAVEILYRKEDALSHRDVLGALMALGLKRETIGDILLETGRAVVFMQRAALPYILSNLEKIGRVGVSLRETGNPELPPPAETQTLERTAQSLRIDSVLSAVLPLSRGKCAALIAGGLVSLRFEECRKTDAPVGAGDVFSVRGYGKYRLDAVGGQSKKGRLHITIKRYL